MFTPSPDRMRKLASQVDISDEDVQEALLTVLEEKAEPQFEDIRRAAEEAEEQEVAREVIESMDEEQKNRLFHETWAELIAAAVELRINPLDGMRNFKTMIRDPYTLEAILLLFEDDETPGEVVEANKDLVSDYIHWMGCAIAPEMYSREEVEEMVDAFGADPELLDKWDESDIPDAGDITPPD